MQRQFAAMGVFRQQARQAANEKFPDPAKSLRGALPKMHPARGTADQLAGFFLSKF